MTVRIRVNPGLNFEFFRLFFLLTGVAALGYSGWVAADEYLHQRQVAAGFERARSIRTPALHKQAQIRTVPDPGPSSPVAPVEEDPFPARLTISRLHLAVMIEEGVEAGTLRRSAGHIPGTAVPGGLGNMGVAAHRDTLFRGLKDIREHDRIQVSTTSKDFSYEVTGTSIVRPRDLEVLAPSPGQKTLTLVTCYPFNFVGNAPHRFIVRAVQVDAQSPGK